MNVFLQAVSISYRIIGMEKTTNTYETTENYGIPKAILVGLDHSAKDNTKFEKSMKELEALTVACDLEVAATITQTLPHPEGSTFIGSGKVEELKGAIEMLDADIVIFGDQLSPIQIRNLERILDTEVIDRTGLILQIFAKRARTRESRMQVEYAQLQFMLPRLAGMRSELSRQGGGSGRLSNKGAGEKKLELDRRRIEHRCAELRRELDNIERERDTQRSRRLNSDIPRISLVGYTNAGKSTLLNSLLDASHTEDVENKKVMQKDMLFATLDTTVRRIDVPGHRPFLLSDTVGFIDELPTTLVKAFRSTLAEATYADLLLEVIDFSDPEYMNHIEVTERTLREIGAGQIPVIYVFNKADLVVGGSEHSGMTIPHTRNDRIYMSAEDGIGIDELVTLIERTLEGEKVECEFLIPYSDGGALHDLTGCSEVLNTEYTEEGTHLTLKCGKKVALNYMKYAI